MRYYTISEMIEAIDEPNRTACRRLYDENVELFKRMPGSSNNHQAWEGGYFDHITEVMNVCVSLFPIYNVRKLNFTLSDALLVMFLHDLEKPWKETLLTTANKEIEIAKGCSGGWITLDTKESIIKDVRKKFREHKIQEYGIVLSEQQQNALKYVEGENADYSNKRRVMNELAAFCHIADVSSARIWHDQGKTKEW